MVRHQKRRKERLLFPHPQTANQLASEEVEKSRPEVFDEESISGDMPDPEQIDKEDNLSHAQKAGLYSDATDSDPKELGIGEELNRNQREEWET